MTRRIVVLDDETHIARAVSMKLRKAGFEVETASDGQLALEAIQREVPSLLVTDCQMPRMDGIELCRRLRDQAVTARLPIILLTAKAYELEHETLKSQLRLSHILHKPFSPRELLALIRETLDITGEVTQLA